MCLFVCMSECVYIFTCVCVYICVRMCAYIFMYGVCVSVLYVCVRVYVCVYIYLCVAVCIYVYTYTYICLPNFQETPEIKMSLTIFPFAETCLLIWPQFSQFLKKEDGEWRVHEESSTNKSQTKKKPYTVFLPCF